MLVLLLISRIVFEYIKAISRLTKIDVGRWKINGMCKNNKNVFQFLSLRIIEQVYINATDIEEFLWHREKYWQSQLFTTNHGMNSLTDLYCFKHKRYRKKVIIIIYYYYLFNYYSWQNCKILVLNRIVQF